VRQQLSYLIGSRRISPWLAYLLMCRCPEIQIVFLDLIVPLNACMRKEPRMLHSRFSLVSTVSVSLPLCLIFLGQLAAHCTLHDVRQHFLCDRNCLAWWLDLQNEDQKALTWNENACSYYLCIWTNKQWKNLHNARCHRECHFWHLWVHPEGIIAHLSSYLDYLFLPQDCVVQQSHRAGKSSVCKLTVLIMSRALIFPLYMSRTRTGILCSKFQHWRFTTRLWRICWLQIQTPFDFLMTKM
jgi:hypothetical protein